MGALAGHGAGSAMTIKSPTSFAMNTDSPRDAARKIESSTERAMKTESPMGSAKKVTGHVGSGGSMVRRWIGTAQTDVTAASLAAVETRASAGEVRALAQSAARRLCGHVWTSLALRALDKVRLVPESSLVASLSSTS